MIDRARRASNAEDTGLVAMHFGRSWPLFFAAACASAQTSWLTVVGDESNAGAETVQVNPVPIAMDAADISTKLVRVNRSEQRTSWDGIPYRSYTAKVRFDCKILTAQYLSIEFHAQPLWVGDKTGPVDYTSGPKRMMRFMDMQPNPSATIVRAACGRRTGPLPKQ